MDLGIKGRRALVFGGSRGIGRAVAGALAAEGTEVAVCARKKWAAQKVASEAAENSGVRAKGYRIDAWDAQSTNVLIKRIVDDFGAIDILFGVSRRPVLEDRNVLPPGGWQTLLDRGFLRFKVVTETLQPGMRDRQWGRILWLIPWPAAGTRLERELHSVTTAALSAWLESIAVNVAKDNVTANILRPAPISRNTGSHATSGNQEALGSSTQSRADQTLPTRNVAATATFLLSDLAGGVFGSTIFLSGTRNATPTKPKV